MIKQNVSMLFELCGNFLFHRHFVTGKTAFAT
jgi:hypothetical protein